jgi:hypothetical protein
MAANCDGLVNVKSLGNAELEVACSVDGDYTSFPELKI